MGEGAVDGPGELHQPSPVGEDDGTHAHIVSVHRDAGSQVSITFDREMDQHTTNVYFDPAFPLRIHKPAWSADGRTVTFIRDTTEALPSGAALKFTVNPPGPPGAEFVDLEGRRALTRTFRFTIRGKP
jgi:hypothetical protein